MVEAAALVVHYLADLQLGHGLHCCGNITQMRNVSEYMLALALCLVTCMYVVCSFVLCVSYVFMYVATLWCRNKYRSNDSVILCC